MRLYSPPTEIHQTEPLGPPLSPPIIRQCIALDYSHIAVFWLPGRFQNGPITHYRLRLYQNHSSTSIQILQEKVSIK